MDITISNKPFPSFGIYLRTKQTGLGECISGKYRGYNISIYDNKRYNMKLYYISKDLLGWVKSKLIYIIDGTKDYKIRKE